MLPASCLVKQGDAAFHPCEFWLKFYQFDQLLYHSSKFKQSGNGAGMYAGKRKHLKYDNVIAYEKNFVHTIWVGFSFTVP